MAGKKQDLLKKTHKDEWEQKNEALQKLVEEKTTDLQNKNRELEIEAALERVRAKAMAMRSSEDISETVDTFFSELVDLEVNTRRCGMGIINAETKRVDIHANTYTKDNRIEKIVGNLTLKGHPVLENIFKNWITKEEYHPTLKGKEILDYYKAMNPEVVFPDFADDETQFGYYFFFDEGGVFAWTDEELPEQNLQIFRRFNSVLNLTYRRYFDLKEAEAQAKEAQIELALERIRAQAMAMNESSDLLDIVVTMRTEFVNLGHEAHYFWHMRWLPDKYKKAMTSGDGTRIGMVMTLPRHIHGDIKLVDQWEKGKTPSLIFPMNVETAVNYVDKMITLGDFEQVDPNAPSLDDVRHIGGITFIMARTTHGEIGYSLPGNVPNPSTDGVETLTRFAGAFDLAYRRFEDLKESEALAAQAKDDLIKLKIEKKRAEDALAELRVTQTQLIHAEKMASLGELTAGIAHEIQNPLNFVNNFSEVSADLVNEMNEEIKAGNTEDVIEISNDLKQNLEKINVHGKRASFIINGMLEHSRSSTGEKKPTDLNVLADEFFKLSYHGLRAKNKFFNAEMRTDFDETLSPINVVAQDIGRVMLNLINNAFHAVNAKKKKPDENYKPRVTVSTKLENENVIISVKDNGNGIPNGILEKIFQPFFTTKPTGEGTGLGLSLSYDIITKGHNGELRVNTKEGEGTEFIIVLTENQNNL